ncbi:hypothetical protein C8R46DRAFT_1042146 [Mycena filopes]|nr:hypothetical protein C8R46DRAFT_1042146 [Mycena filopes]
MQTVPTAGIESSEVYLSVVPQQRHGSPRFEEPHSARGYQVQLSRDQVRGVVRRILALKADGMPCLWRESSLSRHPDHNGIVSAFMMGYVVGEISELTWRKYTGVAARYLEVGAPLHPTGTSASEAFKYMAGVYRLQTRQFKSFFASGYTRLDEFHGEVMRVGTPEDSRFPGRSLLGRMVLIYLNIWPHEHRLELQAFGFIREKEFWRKTQSESTPFLANAAFAISEVYCRGVLSLGAEFSLYAANAARFRIVYIYLELRTQVDDCVTHQYWGLTRMHRLISLTPHILEGLAEKSAETTGRRRARIHRSNDMLEYTPDMTGEKFKIQHLGALVAGVHSRGKFWSTDLLEWNRGPGHLKRAFKIRQKFTNLVFLPFAWMEVRNAHTVLDPTLAWLSRRVSSELLDGVFYRVACDAGVPICRTRCDAGEFLDANEFPSPDRQTQANKVDISHSGEFHQKRTGGQISQRELYIRERESKLSFGVQRGFYDPSGVHLDTTLPRPNLARNQTRISMNIDESAGASGRRACLVWSPSLKHRKLWSLTSPRGRRMDLDEYCSSQRSVWCLASAALTNVSQRLNVNVDGNGGGDGGTSPASGSGHRAAYVSLSSCRCSQRQDDAAAPSYGRPPSPAHELDMSARTTRPRRVLHVGMHHFCFNTLVLTPYSGKARNDRSGALPPLLSLRLNHARRPRCRWLSVNVDGNGGGDGGKSPTSGSGHRAAYVSLSSCRCSQRQDDAAAPSYGRPPSPAHELTCPQGRRTGLVARNDRSAQRSVWCLASAALTSGWLSVNVGGNGGGKSPASGSGYKHLTCLFQAVGYYYVSPLPPLAAADCDTSDKTTRLPPAPAPAVTHVRAGHARELLFLDCASLGRPPPSAFRAVRRCRRSIIACHGVASTAVQDFVYPDRLAAAAGPWFPHSQANAAKGWEGTARRSTPLQRWTMPLLSRDFGRLGAFFVRSPPPSVLYHRPHERRTARCCPEPLARIPGATVFVGANTRQRRLTEGTQTRHPPQSLVRDHLQQRARQASQASRRESVVKIGEGRVESQRNAPCDFADYEVMSWDDEDLGGPTVVSWVLVASKVWQRKREECSSWKTRRDTFRYRRGGIRGRVPRLHTGRSQRRSRTLPGGTIFRRQYSAALSMAYTLKEKKHHEKHLHGTSTGPWKFGAASITPCCLRRKSHIDGRNQDCATPLPVSRNHLRALGAIG